MSVLRKRPGGLLIDLSGTIHIEDKAIPGCVEAVKLLRSSRVPFLFVTNTTKESQRSLKSRLDRCGFDIKNEEIFSSLTAAHDLVRGRNLRPLLILNDDALEDFQDVSQKDPNAVVVGLAQEKFDYNNLTAAFRLIKDKGAPLIAINKSRYFASKDGLSLGAGCFVSGLEYSADVTAEVVGKPEAGFFNSALSKLNRNNSTDLQSENICMVGDDVRDDVLGAQKAGFMGCLVKTGKYKDGDESKTDESPTFCYGNLLEAVESWLKM